MEERRIERFKLWHLGVMCIAVGLGAHYLNIKLDDDLNVFLGIVGGLLIIADLGIRAW